MRQVCISGFSSLSRDWVNELPDNVEIWAMNEAHIFLKRKASRWFQIHPKNWRATPVGQKAYIFLAHCRTCEWAETGKADEQQAVDIVKQRAQVHLKANPEHDIRAGNIRVRKNGYGRPPHHLKWLQRCGIPVYQMKVDSRIPTSTRYPYDEIVEAYGEEWAGGKKRPYLTSTAAFMVALALYEHDNGDKIDRIYMAGIELAIGTEYFHQRPCLEYWIGMAKGRGIEFEASPYGTTLLQGQIYAVEHGEPLHPESMIAHDVIATSKAPVVAVTEDELGNPVGF